ncbi:MAG: hypothetical protein GY839_00635 [candidate division Zixibacteria bacterium]|nr:hypothetical protein [candidate division Zixibacteria bacterium]
MSLLKVSMVYAALLIFLGLIAFVVTGMEHKTALIPAYFGLLAIILALVALIEKYRQHMMHALSILAFIGFLGTFGGVIDLLTVFSGGEVTNPGAATAKAIMSILSLIFFGFCFASFISTRLKKKKDATEAPKA